MKIKIHKILKLTRILLLLMLSSLSGFSQQAEFMRSLHFSEDVGLSNNLVYDMAQDKNGFLWIATSNGLNRFDGKSFHVFRKNYTDNNSLLDNVIIRTTVDSFNNIWVGYGSEGISCYNQVTRKFTHYIPDSTNSNSLQPGPIDEIQFDKDGILWIGVAKKGLMSFNPVTKKFKNYGLLPFVSKERSLNGQLHYNRLTQIIVDGDILWIAAGDGFYSFSRKTEKFKVYRFEEGPENINKWKRDVFNSICKVSDNDFYLAGWGTGLNHYDMKNNKWTTFLLRPETAESGTKNIINHIERKNDDELWIASNDTNLSIFNMRDKQFHCFPADIGNPLSVTNNTARTCFTDASGDLWVGHTYGLHFVNQNKSRFKFEKVHVTYTESANFYGITQLLHDPVTKSLMISTVMADGFNVIDSNGVQKNHPYNNERVELNNQYGSMVLNDSENNLWVITGRAIMQYDRNRKRLIDIPQPVPDTSTKGFPYFAEVAEDQKGNLWFSTHRHGVYAYNSKTKKYSQYFHKPDNSNSLLSNIITGIAVDNNGDVWVGYKNHGVSKLTISNQSFTHFRATKNDNSKLIDDRVLCVQRAPNGSIWIGTFSGITVINPNENGGVINNFIHGQEFLGIIVRDIVFDDSGNAWFLDSRGLSVYMPEKNKTKTFNKTDGLFSLYEELSVSKGLGDTIYIGTFSGYYKFSTSIGNEQAEISDVIITSLSGGGKEIFYERELIENGEVNLNAKDNFFNIEFISINYKNPGNISYRYKLDGLDKDWRSTVSTGFASYNHLPGGNYVFQVQAYKSGEWGKVTSLPIFISTPFYKTWWFTLLAALLFAGAIFSLYKYRVQTIEKTEAIKTKFNKKLAETEMRALRAQMNPHFIFNCLNSINRYIIKNDQKTASLYLTKFAKLIRIILDNSEAQEVALSQELEAVKLYIEIEALRFDHKFSFEIRVDDDISTDNIQIPSMIIQPYVENAIWHGLLHKDTPGRLLLDFKLKDKLLVCVIQDDGIGRAKAMELKSKSATTRKSMGLKITSDRLNIFNEKSEIKGGITFEDLYENDLPCGTRVIVNIPVENT